MSIFVAEIVHDFYSFVDVLLFYVLPTLFQFLSRCLKIIKGRKNEHFQAMAMVLNQRRKLVLIMSVTARIRKLLLQDRQPQYFK